MTHEAELEGCTGTQRDREAKTVSLTGNGASRQRGGDSAADRKRYRDSRVTLSWTNERRMKERITCGSIGTSTYREGQA